MKTYPTSIRGARFSALAFAVLVICSSVFAALPAREEAAIRASVSAQMKDYLSAVVARDANKIVGYYANEPAFRVYFDGKEMGYPELASLVHTHLAKLKKVEAVSEKHLVVPLGPETALASFQFLRTDTFVDGKVARNRGTASWVWAKRGNDWKLLHGHAVHVPDSASDASPAVRQHGTDAAHAHAPIATKKIFENDKIAVWEMTLEPGESTGLHHHKNDYMFYVIEGNTTGEVSDKDGKVLGRMVAKPGDSFFFKKAGDEFVADGHRYPAVHSARNIGNVRFREILVESKSASDNSADEKAIAALHDARIRAFEAGDVDKWLAMVAPDAVFMPMDAPTASNREELRKFYTTWFGSTRIGLKIDRDEVIIRDDLAFVRGRVAVTETPRTGGRSKTDARRFVEIFKKSPTSEWQFWRVTWNATQGARTKQATSQ